jgi:hypothetical protein
MMLYTRARSLFQCLARSTSRDVGAASALLSTSDAVASPGPVRAAALTAKNVNINTLGGNSTLDVLDGEASDRNTSGGLASRGAILVILLDDNAVLGNVLEGNVLVGDARDGTGGTRDGLDADTVVRVDDGGIRDDDVLDGVVAASTYRANGDAVSARAGATGEMDVRTGVDSQAVVLVLDVGVGDVHTSGAANIESIGVVSAVGNIASSVVDGDLIEGEVLRAVDGETLYGSVLDIESGNRG